MAFDPTPESPNVTDGDGHIIRLGSVVITPSAETNNIAGGPATAVDNAAQDYGVGNSLTAIFGLNAAEQLALVGQVVRFAYLVVPRDFEHQVQIRVKLLV